MQRFDKKKIFVSALDAFMKSVSGMSMDQYLVKALAAENARLKKAKFDVIAKTASDKAILQGDVPLGLVEDEDLSPEVLKLFKFVLSPAECELIASAMEKGSHAWPSKAQAIAAARKSLSLTEFVKTKVAPSTAQKDEKIKPASPPDASGEETNG